MGGFSTVGTISTMYADNVNFSGAKTPQVTANGQLLIGSTSAPNIRVATLTEGTGINITNGAGSITIAAAGGGLDWSNIGANQTLAVNNGYFCSTGGALSLALPSSSSVGDAIAVSLVGSTSWTITQGAGQQIRIGNTTSTLGAGGSIASTAQGDSIWLVCQTANTIWVAVNNPVGALTVT